MYDFITELDNNNLQSTLEQSLETPVLVYFWAPSLPKTVEIKETIEKIIIQNKGAMILALLNCETEQQLAAQFGVQELPTIAIFKDGRAADGISGEQTEEQINELLDKYLPNISELKLAEAQQQIEAENYTEALETLNSLKSDLELDPKFQLTMAQCTVALKQFDEAQIWLDKIRLQDQDSDYKALIAAIELHQKAAETPEIKALQTQYDQNPNDMNTAYKLAISLSQVNKQEQALQLLITILTHDINFEDGNAKKTMLDILATLGQNSTFASQYRRQLYTLLY